MSNKPKAYRNITEAASEIGVEPHVLRYWESRFSQLQPMTRGGSRRFYSISDMELLGALKQVLHVDGVPIRAAARKLDELGTAAFISKTMSDAAANDTGQSENRVQLNAIDQLIQNAKNDIAWLKASISNISAIESSQS